MEEETLPAAAPELMAPAAPPPPPMDWRKSAWAPSPPVWMTRSAICEERPRVTEEAMPPLPSFVVSEPVAPSE